jgi:hypothetical protein
MIILTFIYNRNTAAKSDGLTSRFRGYGPELSGGGRELALSDQT